MGKFIAFTSLIPPTTFSNSLKKYILCNSAGQFVFHKKAISFNIDYILCAFGLPSISCRRYYADRHFWRKKKIKPPSNNRKAPDALQCTLMTLKRSKNQINPLTSWSLHFFLVVCISTLLQLPAK